MPLDPKLMEILACPACHAPLREQQSEAQGAKEQDEELACTSTSCGLVYPVRDQIPVLLVDEARRP